MVHVSEVLIKGIMSANNEQTSKTEFLKYKNHGKSTSDCCLSFKDMLICLICSTLSIALVVVLMYFYGPTYKMMHSNIHEFEKLMNSHDPIIENIRLPTDLKPIHYRLRIHPILQNDSNNFTFTGRATILMECINATDSITINFEKLNLTNIELTRNENEHILPKDEFVSYDRSLDGKVYVKRDAEEFKIDSNLLKYHRTKVVYVEIIHKDFEKDRLVLKLNEFLAEGIKYVLDLHYHGNISNDLVGFYRSSYFDDSGLKRWIATTHMQPIYARRVFPCFDEPIFKSEFEISIARQTNMSSLSNMPLKETEPMKNVSGWVWDHFKTTKRMSTYLVAFTISNFKSYNISTHKPGPVLKIWAPKHLLNKCRYAVEITSSILHFYENYFQIKYCLPKLDLIVIPHFGKGAMENWGLISFRDSSILLDNTTDSIAIRQHIFNIIAHQLAHQWFGNLITMEWWSDLWLNEGFATYMATVAEIYLKPEWESDAKFALEVTHEALSSDSFKATHALHMAVVNNYDIEQLFDPVMYNKASCLLKMINDTLGEESFRNGIRDYINTWLYNSTSEDSLWRALTNCSKERLPIGRIMSTWTRQIGYPLITIRRNYSNHENIITQSRFGNSSNNIGYWSVPINYISQHSKDQSMILMDSRSITLNITAKQDEWLLFNIEQTGFYRVNYDLANWELIINQLNKNHQVFSVTTRAQLINDAFELSKAGYLDYNISFSLLHYLPQNERNYVPWKTALNALNYVNNIFMDTTYYGVFQDYILNLVKPLNIFHNNFKSNYTKLEVLVIDTFCNMHDEKWTKYVQTLYDFEKHQLGESNVTLNYDISQAVYCTSIEMGGESEWDFIWNKTLDRNISGNQLRILYLSLGCTKESWIINRYLEKTLTGEILSQNVMYVWRSISQRDVGRMTGIKFLEENWKKIYRVYKIKFTVLQAIVEEYLSNLSSPNDLKSLTSFYIKYKEELKSLASLIKAAVDKIKFKIIWKKKYMDIVLTHLSTINA